VIEYDGYDRFWWEHRIVDASGVQTFSMQNQTLFDAPTNNFSSSIDVNSFIDFEEDYRFESFWNNATDIAIWGDNFTVNKVQFQFLFQALFSIAVSSRMISCPSMRA